MFKRIFAGYLAIMLISFVVLALAFSLTVRQYLINDTVRSLYRVAETLSAETLSLGRHGGGQMRGAFFSLANHIAYADYLVLRADGVIIESSDYENYPPGLINTNEAFTNLAFGENSKESLIERDRVAVVFPAVVAGEKQKSALILYSRLDMLTQLNRSILNILALALGAGAIVALAAGAFATRVAVGPLQQLKTRATELAARRFHGKLNINTGDELEALAEAFNEMAGQLAEHDRTQKVFFQKASHELKTPLMSVQGYAEALREGVIPPEEAQHSLDIIIKESRRMKALVDEFIYLSKMETIRDDFHPAPLSLEEAVKEAVHSLNSLALDRSVTIETITMPGLKTIEGDAEMIHRLLLNTVGNALRYARATVTVTTGHREILVEDDGPGFAAGEEERVFEPFYNGKNGGSGLGLAISRAIMEKHGARITAGRSATTGGARIRLDFSKTNRS